MDKFVKPKNGLIVRDPFTKTPLPSKGAYVDWSGQAGRYWRRRVRDGSVSIEEKPVSNATTSRKRIKNDDNVQ